MSEININKGGFNGRMNINILLLGRHSCRYMTKIHFTEVLE